MSSDALVDQVRGQLSGAVVAPGDADYDAARRIWNGDIDKRPALVARPESVAEVQAVVRIAAEHGVLLAVRGGGHSFAGHSTCDDGIVLDLARLRGVEVDPSARRAHAQGGALLGDLDRAAQAHGLVTPAGVVSHTGVAGLTLGGGHGYLARRHGLSCDNLRAVDLVTAEGELVTVSDDTDPELMWGLRGGGGNFGVVTRFEYDTHEQGDVLAGWLVYPFEDAAEFLSFYADVVRTMPREMCPTVRLLVPSTSPVLPDELRGTGRNFTGMRFVWTGDLAEGHVHMKEVAASWRPPVASSVEEVSFVDLQSSIDVTATHGLGRYAKCGYLMDLPAEMAPKAMELQLTAPTPLCEIVFFPLGGRVAEIADDATAYSSRGARFMYEVRATWSDPAERDAVVSWCRETYAFIDQFAMPGIYVNMVLNDGEAGVRKSYGDAKFDRLADIKTRLDPDNVFRLNQNVPPRARV
jgi:FAD/FMN-containing dehydrogenase